MKKILSLLLVVLSLLGIMDAGYLTYEKLSGKIPVCGQGFDCGKVLQSSWSSIGPIPLSALGLLFYSTVFLLAVAHFLEYDLVKVVTKKYTTQQALLALGLFGFGFSVYLVFLMGIIIQGWCLYCLISAAISSLLFLTNLGLYFTAKET